MILEISHTIRVRYVECDRMGFVHHSVYAMYFEEARTEGLRALGVRYKDLEDNGIIMPVRNMSIQFKRAAVYDDLLTIKTYLHLPGGIRCLFEYETYNEQGELLNTATTELFFAEKASLKPIRLPESIQQHLKTS
ncbi:MAG: acyl-CoA thioesterase [Bacteroidia bacterium]